MVVALALVTGLLATACVGAYYLRKPSTIENIRTATSGALGGEVRFRDIDLKPFKGVDVEGIRVHAARDPEPGPEFLTLHRLALNYVPWRLLQRVIEFRSIQIEEPALILRQRRDGTWILPRLNTGTLAERLTFQTGLLRFRILLDDFNLVNGRLLLLAPSGETVFEARGAGLDGRLVLTPGGGRAEGNLSLREMSWANALRVDHVRSPLRLENDLLTLPAIEGEVHGGRATGAARIDLAAEGPLFAADLKVEGINLAALMEQLKSAAGLAAGTAQFTLQCSGSMRQPTLVQGTGELRIREARVSLLSGAPALARLLQIPELQAHTFTEASGTFKVADERLTFYDLEAVSDRLQLTATGSVGLDRTLDFDVLIALHPELAGRLPEASRKRLAQRADGFSSVTFKLDGTLDQPRSNLPEKIGLNAEPEPAASAPAPAAPPPAKPAAVPARTP